MTDALRFPIGRLTRFVSPSGAEYMRGRLGGLTITVVAEPDAEPAAGGDMSFVMLASATPGGIPYARQRKSPVHSNPAPEAARPSAPANLPKVASAPKRSRAEQQELAAAMILLETPLLPLHGDSLEDLTFDQVKERAEA